MTPDYVNPYVRLFMNENNEYILEVMLPIDAKTEDIKVHQNPDFHPDEELFYTNVNYLVELGYSAPFSADKYTFKTIKLERQLTSKRILVRTVDTSFKPPFRGPKPDGKTIIQFEDAER